MSDVTSQGDREVALVNKALEYAKERDAALKRVAELEKYIQTFAPYVQCHECNKWHPQGLPCTCVDDAKAHGLAGVCPECGSVLADDGCPDCDYKQSWVLDE